MNITDEIKKEDVLIYQTQLNDDRNRRDSTMGRELRRIEDIVHIERWFPQATKVLCIGARDDSEVQTFINHGWDAKGIDICTQTDLITKMDVASLNEDFGVFDVVYCSHVLEHVIDPIKTMKAIRSVTIDGIFIILPIVDRPPDIEHPTVYEIMRHNPETRFNNFPQAWEDFAPFNPCSVRYNCYRNGFTEDYEIAFMLEVL